MDIPTQPTHRPFLRKKKHPPFFRKAVGWVGWLLKIPPKITDAIPVMAHTWHSDIETRRLLRHRRCWRFCANETILHGPKTQRRRAATVDVEGLSLQLGRPRRSPNTSLVLPASKSWSAWSLARRNQGLVACGIMQRSGSGRGASGAASACPPAFGAFQCGK